MASEWRQAPERGNQLGIVILLWVSRFLGRRVLIAILYPIIFYFWLTAGQARRASRDYLQRCLGKPPRWYQTYRHLLTFAIVACDRMLLLSGRDKPFHITLHGDGVFDTLGDAGAILATSHLGSFDALRIAGNRNLSAPLHILLDVQHNARAMGMISALDPALAANIIDAGAPGPSLALQINDCLAAGHWVGIMVDRAGSDEAVQRLPFLGGDAAFPTGPWQLASVLDAPIIACFGLYRGRGHYELHFEMISDGLGGDRRGRQQRIHAAMSLYSQRLAHYARQHPYNWFNFYDFWQ